MARRPVEARELAYQMRIRARRARRLAGTQPTDEKARLTRYAGELEKEAADLDREADQQVTPAASPPRGSACGCG